MLNTRRFVAYVAVGLAIALGLVAAPAASGSTAAATAPGAASLVLRLTGHGWGHGRGMGQFGANGYARAPFNWSVGQILAHFYGGTTAANIGNPVIEVVLNGPNSTTYTGLTGATTVFIERGTPRLSVAGGPPAVAPDRAVRVARTGNGTFQVQYGPSCAGPWGPAANGTGSYVNILQPVDAADVLDDTLQLCDGAMSGGNPDDRRWLRGAIRARVAGSRQFTTNAVLTESYLRGVVPREMPATWPAAAVQAQSVAARSYAHADAVARQGVYGIRATCDTISCQVYAGRQRRWGGSVVAEHASSDAAIVATAGSLRVPAGWTPGQPPSRTEFSSSTGGWTAGGAFPAVEDLGDSNPAEFNPNHTWTASVTSTSIEAAYGRPAGSFVTARVTSRNGLGELGGRVTSLELTFANGAITVSGNDFRSRLGLRSNWFTFVPPCRPEWSQWFNLGGRLASGTSAVSLSPDRLDVFAIAGSSESRLFQRTWVGGWGAWTDLGQPPGVSLRNTPGSVTWRNGRIDVFVRGSDGALWQRFAEPGTEWGSWINLGGRLTGGVTVVAQSPNRLDVFVVAGSSGDRLFQRTWAGIWGPWVDLGRPGGAGLTGAPAAVTWANGRIDVFARGTNGALWQRWWDGRAWSSWTSLGGVLQSAPSAVSPRAGNLDVFAVAGSSSDRLFVRSWSGAWDEWADLGHPLGVGLNAQPGAVTWSDGRVDVFTRGTDGALWQRYHPCL